MGAQRGSFESSGERKFVKSIFALLAAGTTLAAASLHANDQSLGYVAPPALSSVNFERNNIVSYTPWFETDTYRGDLLALPVNSRGQAAVQAPIWRAAQILDKQDYLTGRRIVTTDGLGSAIPFRFTNLTPSQQLEVSSASIVDYIRGDRRNESSNGMRVRSGVLGDIIHSAPVYVGRPTAGYIADGYLEFAADNAARTPLVFAGANDGMLHAFDAATGSEAYAYVPSMVLSKLPQLAVQPYKHQYFVDGVLTVEDVQFGDRWKSVLVGGLAAGGKGYYALDVTDASAATESDAAAKILWEFRDTSDGAGNLGLSYSRPSIVRLNNDRWAGIVGNGYSSTSGVASLYILDIRTGSVIRELTVPDDDANGLSSPTLIDTDADGMVDFAFAGDLNGNLWRFDLRGTNPTSWSVSWGGQPLFKTAMVGNVRQSITTAPEVGRHPNGGVMIYIGTGRLLNPPDHDIKSTQAVYGIWDNDRDATDVPINASRLVQQQLKSAIHRSTGSNTRTATDNRPDWSSHRGWAMPLIAGDSTVDQGERVLQDILLRDGRISLMAVNPTVPGGDNWFIQLDAMTGGAPGKTIVDINADFLLDVQDNVDGNSDATVGDTPEDRVVGQELSFGLASQPVYGVLDRGGDTALINHLTGDSPAAEANSGHTISSTKIGGNNTGRLFWREVVLQE